MNAHDECLRTLCSIPGSRCDCGFSNFAWSTPTPQKSFCAFNGSPEKTASVDVDVDVSAFRPTYGNHLVGDASENTDLEAGASFQYGSQRPCLASTPKNTDYAENWESPEAMPPPDSSSPIGLGTDHSPFATTPTPSKLRREDVIENRRLPCRPLDSGRFNNRVPVTPSIYRFPSHSTPNFQVQEVPSARMDIGASLQAQGCPADAPESGFPAPGCHLPQRGRDKHLHAISERQAATDGVPANVQDICVATTRTAVEQPRNIDKICPVSAPQSSVPTSCEGSGFGVPGLAKLTEPNAPSHGIEHGECRGATATSNETHGNDGIPLNMLRGLSVVSDPSTVRATIDNRRKRRRSSIDCTPELKKAKLDRAVSHVSCSSNSSVAFEYEATEPASIRRARSLRSEVSACSEVSTDPHFYPSPLTPRPGPDRDDLPTAPSTPLPSSTDYSRSKAHPLVRTVAVYRSRSFKTSAIPPVPIIAPPGRLTPALVRCAEDQAIDRLHALLRRERSERERDGLHVHDKRRLERLEATYPTDLALSRRDSASTSHSSDGLGQWEEESTRSAVESQESQGPAPGMKILSVQHRPIHQEIWSNAFGIPNDFRKEVTRWILKTLPEEPVQGIAPPPGGRHPIGIDLYDQLANSRQTRFHAAHLFHRYFLFPEKVQLWGGLRKHDVFEREPWGLYHESSWERGVWDLAVAFVALSVKLHRDCLPPLDPVYAEEFLDMAPHFLTHETFELAQRDIMCTFQFLLGSCTPQDVLDELWNALPTLRKVTMSMQDGWTVVQSVVWDKLFESLLEPDMLQYPVSLLTAAALIDGLILALARHYKAEAEARVCQCKAPPRSSVSGCVRSGTESMSWQIYFFEATQLVVDVILDVKDVLRLSQMELDECRRWLSHVGPE